MEWKALFLLIFLSEEFQYKVKVVSIVEDVVLALLSQGYRFMLTLCPRPYKLHYGLVLVCNVFL